MKSPEQAASQALRETLARIVELEQTGELGSATSLCEELLATTPGSVPLQVFKARLLRQQGEHQAAASALDLAASQAPNSVAVLGEQGKLALARGDPESARKRFQSLVAIRPDHAESWFNLGNASERAQRHSTAAEAYRRALSLGIAQPEEVMTRLGVVLIAMGREEEALGHFDQALAINERDYQALYSKGMIMQALGDFEAAEQHFLAAIEVNPDFVEAYQQLAESKHFDNLDDVAAVRMRELLDTPLSEEAQEKLNFALGKICNDCGEYDAAFRHFTTANALKKDRRPPFDRAAHRALTDAVINYFQRDNMVPAKDLVPLPVTPVFIVGMPRSGTTLIEQILSSHAEVAGAGELAFMEGLSRSVVEDYPRGLDKLRNSRINEIREEYAREIAAHIQGHRYVTDKFPANFVHLGLINTVFPEARMIYSKRDAMDNCLSVFMQDFGTGNYYSNNLDDIAFYYRCHQELMAHWQAIFGARLLQVNYEDVIAEQEQATRRLLAFLELEWQDACLAFDKNPRKIATLSRWQVRQPIYTTAAGRWRRYAKHLGALQQALDYKDRDEA